MSEDLRPVLVGAGQFTQQGVDPRRALDPLSLMVEAVERASDDAGVARRSLAAVDSLAVVGVMSWRYQNAPRLLAGRLGLGPTEQLVTTIGGNMPQRLVNEAAVKISSGRIGMALLVGGEAFATRRRARRTGTALTWPSGGDGTPTLVGDWREPSTTYERVHGFTHPPHVYPLFENALRAHYGLGIDAHRERLGELCARLSAIAARNPFAWFPTARSPAEIAKVSSENRMVAFPYTKYMNAILDVDQSGAVLMTSAAGARSLGIPEQQWVYWWGGSDTVEDRWFVSERANYFSAPALGRAAEHALQLAGIDSEDVQLFDLYSCFPSAVQIACDTLGIRREDPRPLTSTGGLPYAGGPGNNYSMHAIASMLPRLRAEPSAKGLVTGVGWYMTRHSVGVYSASPQEAAAQPVKEPTEDGAVPPEAPQLAFDPTGRGVIETYTVIHDRDGRPVRGIVIGRREDGRRFLANTPTDRRVLEDLEEREAIGRTGRVYGHNDTHRFDPD